jgi:hypothetical protein
MAADDLPPEMRLTVSFTTNDGAESIEITWQAGFAPSTDELLALVAACSRAIREM